MENLHLSKKTELKAIRRELKTDEESNVNIWESRDNSEFLIKQQSISKFEINRDLELIRL